MRRHDSGWRDGRLAVAHETYGLPLPVAGMTLPMVEFDHGEPLAVINYIRRDTALPRGRDAAQAYLAMANLYRVDMERLPFLTARYDPRNWAFECFGHNDEARSLLASNRWTTLVEEDFAALLYRLRGRQIPDLTGHGVAWRDDPWIESEGLLAPVDWPGQDLSVRRRVYEPVDRVPHNLLIPTTDIDLSVVGRRSETVTLLVDYKLAGANVNPSNAVHHAVTWLYSAYGNAIPSMIVKYDPIENHWKFRALCLNGAAEHLLRDATGEAAGESHWTPLDESQWRAVLELAHSH